MTLPVFMYRLDGVSATKTTKLRSELFTFDVAFCQLFQGRSIVKRIPVIHRLVMLLLPVFDNVTCFNITGYKQRFDDFKSNVEQSKCYRQYA